jgi:predicted CXXCH cytochrome family protein
MKTAFTLPVLIFMIFHGCSESAFSFDSSEEYSAHMQGRSNCTTKSCHEGLSGNQSQNLHSPVASGECSACHRAEKYPNKYGLETDQRISCSRCHKSMGKEIHSSSVVHAPITNGDCTACHDPHKSVWPFFLRKSYNELCISCHKLTRLYTGAFVHKPVKDGNCGLCHDPHASNFKYRLIDPGFNLCTSCHDEMVIGMTQDYIHTPILKSGCSGCHDPHSGDNKLRLKAPLRQLCFTCHEAKQNEAEQSKHTHKPASTGECGSCHSPHYSDIKSLLLNELDTLCYSCHKESNVWQERRFQHGPVAQGDCAACHNSHGSDNAFILRLPFPHKFYTEYEKGKYSLCFLCHKESLTTVEETETITNFRNGTTNLHRLHVNQKKGRTCRACHDVHASEQEGRIRDEFPFGKVKISLDYSKTDTGGSCIAGCHRERSYDRVKSVKYER